MNQFSAQVRNNRVVAEGLYEVEFATVGVNQIAPGQFLTIRLSQTTTPLLRRPFAFSDYDTQQNTASVIYLKRGAATSFLASRELGDVLDVIAPLGNGFPRPEVGRPVVLVGGGIGLGPVLFMAKSLTLAGRDCVLVVGGRTSGAIPGEDLFEGVNTVICTDDGSRGFAGTTVDYLRSEKLASSDTELYACGPEPMLRACHAYAKETGARCWVSMEQVMACGVGACMGCVVKTNTPAGYARVCKEGPVFNAEEIVWE
jgi:dihydroorotate dehydrogenase electron transfer subunit